MGFYLLHFVINFEERKKKRGERKKLENREKEIEKIICAVFLVEKIKIEKTKPPLKFEKWIQRECDTWKSCGV